MAKAIFLRSVVKRWSVCTRSLKETTSTRSSGPSASMKRRADNWSEFRKLSVEPDRPFRIAARVAEKRRRDLQAAPRRPRLLSRTVWVRSARRELPLPAGACARAARGGRFRRRFRRGDGRGERHGRGRARIRAARAAGVGALGLDRRRALGLLDALARHELVAQLHLLRDAVDVFRLLPALGAAQNLAGLQQLGAVFLVNPDVKGLGHLS